MSRSYRHTSICGLASAASEKDDKRRWHRRFRQRNRQRVRQDREPLPLDAVGDPWAWRRNNVPLHFGLHSCSGFSTLFSQ
jgi:hypothetical protein